MSTCPFPLPIMFTAWVWKDGAGIAGEVIRRARLGGFKTVAVQLSLNTPDNPGDGGSTLDRQDIDYLHEAGLFVVGWDPISNDTPRLFADLPFDGWLPQVEGPGQRDALLSLLRSGLAPKQPRALVTTYGGLDTTADVLALRKLWSDVFTFVECYKADGFPHDQIDRMLAQGAVYGFDRSRLLALVGTYRGEMPAEYPGLDAADYGGIYLEENTNDAQLQAFAALALTPAPDPQPEPEVDPVTDPAALNAQIAKLAEQYPDGHPLSRLNCIADIAESTDATWNEVRQYVRGALDGTVQQTIDAVMKQRDQLNEALKQANAKIAKAKADLA